MSRDEMLNVAVDWWANKLQNVHHDNGDRACALAMMMADMCAMKNNITAEQIDTFKKNLKSNISNNLEHCSLKEIWLDCDYAPDEILSVAAVSAGIDPIRFPFKTGMRISETEVKVSDGYAQPYVVIARLEG